MKDRLLTYLRKIKSIEGVFCIVLIVIGVCIILRPWYNAWRFDRLQRGIMSSWYSGAADVNSSQPATTSKGFGSWTQSSAVLGGDAYSESELWEEDINPRIDTRKISAIVDGVLTIERINLEVPILNKCTVDNLNISICSVIDANKMGQPGNYVLAGHNSRIKGRHFSRLSELRTGDTITVENEDAVFYYYVTSVFTVMPSDTWVMENDGDKGIITLITCDYGTNPAGRLIVRGELIDGNNR